MDDIAVAAEVFCGRMHDDVGSQVEGVLQVGGCKSVVYAEKNTPGAGNGGYGCDVDNIHQGIGGGLRPDEPGIFIYIWSNVSGVLHIDKVKFDAGQLENFGEEAIGAAIHIIGC